MLIASPNPSIDRTIGVERFDAGHVHRARRVEARIGGGGANAARIALRLGAAAELITIVPEADASVISEALSQHRVPVAWVPCRGKVRIATIVREEAGRMSVLNEPGPTVAAHEWEAFLRLAGDRLRAGQILLCSGSLPPGAPADGYAYLAREARHASSHCVIDAAGDVLAATLEAGEGIVVPNLAEAEAVIDGPRPEAVHPKDAPERARDAANRLLRRGAHAAIVTAGGAGAAYAEQGPSGRRGWVPAPEVAARNPIGAGDAFAAGLGLRIESGAPLDEAVAFGVAVAAAHVEAPTEEIEPERVGELTGSPDGAGALAT